MSSTSLPKPDQYTRTLAAAEAILALHPTRPTLGIILGSGLGNFASQVESATTIPVSYTHLTLPTIYSV